MSKRVFIIAEAGVNHNGEFKIAKKLVDAAIASGADAVKFQIYKAKMLVTNTATKAAYQKATTPSNESQMDMLESLQLDYDKHEKLFDYCKSKGIQYISSPFDMDSLDFLISLGVDFIKVSSPDITFLPFLRKLAQSNVGIFLSSGMASLGEIERALSVFDEYGTKKDRIVVLHCNTDYPTNYADANLKAIKTIADAFQIDVGYSDHTIGIDLPVAAIALGATVIEKHFTLDKTMSGPDHSMSLEPQELENMVKSIRKTELALGDGIKKMSAGEEKNYLHVRRSIFAAENINKGELLSEKNLICKRPANGISPMRWDEIIGRKAFKNYKKDEMIQL